MADIFSPFSPTALASLPPKPQRQALYTRADAIPDDAQVDEDGNMPAARDYHAINSLPPQVRVPKKIATPLKVEAKVWFANERSGFIFCPPRLRIHTELLPQLGSRISTLDV
jgi:hypothetical protein